jgi:hypothetical protein
VEYTYKLEYPEIKPSVLPPNKTIVIEMPPIHPVPPTEYIIMEVVVESSRPIYPAVVVIYNQSGNVVFSVRVAQ